MSLSRIRGRRAFALLGLCGVVACGTDRRDDPTGPSTPTVAALAEAGGGEQRLLAGRRSPEPFAVVATGPDGSPVRSAVIDFSLEGVEGVLSQPRALTDSAGVARTYILEPGSGPGTLTARAGEASVAFDIEIERAPGELLFEPGSGEVGLPGLPHPDSVVRVRLLDTEGVPMAGREVFFAGHRRLSEIRDTTDADGWASTVIRETSLGAGPGRVFAFVLGFSEITAFTERPLEAPARRVVLVSVDGLRADAIAELAPPTLSRLLAAGAGTTTARTVSPSLTTPAHLSLMAGVAPEVHGIVQEELEFTPQMVELDPLFKTAESRGVRARAFMADGGPLADFEVILECRIAFGLESLTLVEPDAVAVADAAAATLADPEVRLLFLHVPDPDLAGHEHGFGSAEYASAIGRTDEALARIDALLGPDDLLIVTSDHGGGGAFGSHQHGSESDADMRIPVILSGAHVAPGALDETSILDVAPTAIWALGFAPPAQYEGRILLEGFQSGPPDG